jgi:Transglycosylase-like domain
LRREPPPPPLRVLEGGRKPGMAPAAIRSGFLIGLVVWAAIILLAVVLFFVLMLIDGAIAEASSSSRLSPSTIAFWDGVARCETGSTWTGLGSTYQGGLGIYAPNWDRWAGELGLERRYPDAGDAPRLVQIRVAEYGLEHGAGWGCIR